MRVVEALKEICTSENRPVYCCDNHVLLHNDLPSSDSSIRVDYALQISRLGARRAVSIHVKETTPR
jgi:hypothetical protein